MTQPKEHNKFPVIDHKWIYMNFQINMSKYCLELYSYKRMADKQFNEIRKTMLEQNEKFY